MTERSKKLVVFVVCALSGLFSLLPSIFFYFKAGENFQGVWPELNGDRLYYLSRVEEVLDGEREINHPYFFEHKDEPYPQATGGERFMAFLVKASGMSVANFEVILDFLSPFFITLLTYIFFCGLGVRKNLGILASFFLFTVVSSGVLKPIHPQITFPLLLLFLIFWSKSIIFQKKQIFYSLASGVVLGILFLTYFYHWSFLLVVLGIFALFALAQKNYRLFWNHLLILGTGFLIGLPYFLLIKSGLSSPFHGETMVRVGAYYSHFPETIPRLLVAVAWLSIFAWFGKSVSIFKKPEFLIIFALLLGNVIYPNHQIISGLIIQNANHWSFMPVFLYAFSGLFAITEILKLKNRGEKFFLNLVVALFVLMMIVPALRLMSFNFSSFTNHFKLSSTDFKIEEYKPIFDWLNTKDKDKVVFGNSDMLKYIPVYTHANVYYTDYAFNLPGSDKEVIERALLSQFFNPRFFQGKNFGMTEDTRILWTQPAQSERNTHRIHRLLRLSYEEKYSLDIEKKKVEAVYKELNKAGWKIGLLQKYKIDYIVWDKKTNPSWGLSSYKELRKVETFGNFEIYEFKPTL